MKIAIVHDWLYGGGAEKVVEELHKMYPDAPIYTSYCTDEWRDKLDQRVITGYLNHWPFTKLRKFLPLLRQWWFSSLDLRQYDVVISSSGNGEARFVCSKYKEEHTRRGSIGKSRPLHISYTHTPTHFYWRKYEEYLHNPGFKPARLVRAGLRTLIGYVRQRDYNAAQSIDYLIANSTHIQSDIERYYNRKSEVIHPPVDASRFINKSQLPKKSSGRLITWGRLVPYKRFDLAIAACNQLGVHLDIIGDGPELASLKALAGPTINFMGRASDTELEKAAQRADAFLFAGEEDFGISPVEAMTAGLPVIAYKAGGALDYVVEGKTGMFFADQTVESLVNVINKFKAKEFDPHKIATYAAANFDNKIFHQKMSEFVGRVVAETKEKNKD